VLNKPPEKISGSAIYTSLINILCPPLLVCQQHTILA